MSGENSKNSIKEAFGRHAAVFEKSLSEILPDVERGAAMIMEAVRGGGKVLVCGNGGSAADAQHLAAEFICKYKDDRRPLPAIALTTNASSLTAIGNDYGFENIFSRQVEALGEAGDALVAITTSGRSPNILAAMDVARNKGMKIIILTGQKGAELKKSSDVAVIVPSEEAARIQEIHEITIHSLCEFIDKGL